MNSMNCKPGPQNKRPHRKHLWTVLLAVAMVMVATIPAFATEATVSTSAFDTEPPASTSGLVVAPAEGDAVSSDGTGSEESAPTAGPVTSIDELLDAIARANANDVIEFDGNIQSPPDLILGRADCPVTLRRATPEAHIMLGQRETGNIKVQNITFDGAGIQAIFPIVWTDSPTQVFEKCNFVNCISEGSSALEIAYGDSIISDCHFANNTGLTGAHMRIGSREATIENCTFTGGFASDTGAIYFGITEKIRLTGCTVSGNTAGERAGGVYIEEGEIIITGCKIYGNTANGAKDDITKSHWSLLSLADDYAALVELYKPDGVVPNRWTVDSRYDVFRGTTSECADMIFAMTFADNEPTPPPSPMPTSITLDKSKLALNVGEADTLTATIYPEGADGSIQWTSSDPSVASVSESGLVIANSAGTASITAAAAVSRTSASCLVTVQNAPATTYSIDIGASPVEGGTVSGSGQYEEGATATVTAVPNEGFRLLAWTEADTQISTEASLSFMVNSDRTLVATFEPIPKPTYTINTSAAVGGTVSGGGEYAQGSSVILTASPESGYLFVGWTENDEQISTDERFAFAADRDRTLVANFTPIPKPS